MTQNDPINKGNAAFSNAFALCKGDVVSVIGCAGKTALLYQLAKENRTEIVLLSTTTKIYQPLKEQYDAIYQVGKPLQKGVALAFSSETNGKLSGLAIDELATIYPQNGLTLLEADGSKGLPLKGWALHEPVVPAFTSVTIGVVSLWAVGKPCTEQFVHRPQLFCDLTGAKMGEIITLEHICAMICANGGMFSSAFGRFILFSNQVETPEQALLAQHLYALILRRYPDNQFEIFAGSVHHGIINKIAVS